MRQMRKTDESLTITLNEEVLIILSTNHINTNHLFILLALYEDYYILLDVYDDSNKSLDALLNYQHLSRHGFIEESKSDNIYKISRKGKELVEQVKALFISVDDSDFDSFVQSYLDIFPKGNLPNGYSARGDRNNVRNKLKIFLNKNKQYSKEDILQATKQYVDRFAANNYNFMMIAEHFIQKKDRGSTLAVEIESIKDGNNPDFRQNGFNVA